jgi:hypothetical protein
MQDEARHVAFGRLALRDLYPQLTDAERREREDFVIEACYQMRDRFNQRELWEYLGLPVDTAVDAAMSSENMRLFRYGYGDDPSRRRVQGRTAASVAVLPQRLGQARWALAVSRTSVHCAAE